MTTTQLQHAHIDWNEQGQPLSAEFADVYFSKQSGLDESRYVFIQHNQLTERFQQLDNSTPLVVAETGFGTGLNFLTCWQLFLQQAPEQARLHFISVEKYPLHAADLQLALALWPELEPLSAQLLQQYLVIQPGYQHFIFQQGRVCLTLLIGEASEQLSQLDAKVDAWFLDGFAPSKNPDMWSDALFSQLARLAKPQTTLATFTSAGFVRRGLQAAGFSMQRHPGFGHKREMLSGVFSGSHTASWAAPWFARPTQPSNAEKHAVIIGAGISGCASAYSLAIRGWRVTLIERNPHIALEASGNPQGVLYLKLSAHQTNLTQLILAGFGFSRRLLTHWSENPHFDCCGLL
ncbi:MAG: bifunctional tRNA (5-methylaminomethyl-2-thiouridine)(34)-methyltransferase MnmD/FAD-dependent 5-carboxymethylaminomethyl-2-thiouridine(34) oxidoreductase MnmC, partial [Gammaproteobacteria bacterium]|nr:bifunctional tRNA (5-methylaminomethyl-2-thiouridine)(34)-methyltransferase MnmD/FAD-dependent 5-carboxymethylaminomethyl-2-thiouridine(34) oxidoreductase MnmC [Gammaproteobacteria bacterium]